MLQAADKRLHGRRVARAHLCDKSRAEHRRALLIASFFKVCEIIRPDVVTLGEETEKPVTRFRNFLQFRRRYLIIGFENHLTGFGVDDIGNRIGALELAASIFDFANVRLTQDSSEVREISLPLRTIGSGPRPLISKSTSSRSGSSVRSGT